ncbi:MAG: sugar phosphate nucleotidyltransferase [Planctomycetota bacterium]
MVTKAIIPVAGLGTRLMPVTSVVPKSMLPLVDSRGRIRTVLHHILTEASAAGVRAAGLVVSRRRKQMIEDYLAAARAEGGDELPREIEYIYQDKPEGFGDAVLRGAEFVGSDEAFVLMLGDHVHVAEAGSPPCAVQVASAFESFSGAAMVGMQDVARQALAGVGVARGESIPSCRAETAGGRVYLCADLVEKPDLETARRRLLTPGLPKGRFLAHCGIYIFARAIFDCLEEISSGRGSRGEIELADAQELLLKRHPRDYRLLKTAGRSYDVGTPAGYAAAFRRLSVVG